MAGGLLAGYGTLGVMAARYLYAAGPQAKIWMFVTELRSMQQRASLEFEDEPEESPKYFNFFPDHLYTELIIGLRRSEKRSGVVLGARLTAPGKAAMIGACGSRRATCTDLPG